MTDDGGKSAAEAIKQRVQASCAKQRGEKDCGGGTVVTQEECDAVGGEAAVKSIAMGACHAGCGCQMSGAKIMKSSGGYLVLVTSYDPASHVPKKTNWYDF